MHDIIPEDIFPKTALRMLHRGDFRFIHDEGAQALEMLARTVQKQLEDTNTLSRSKKS